LRAEAEGDIPQAAELLDKYFPYISDASPRGDQLASIWEIFHDLAWHHRQWEGGMDGRDPQRLMPSELYAYCEIYGIAVELRGTLAEHVRRMDDIWMNHTTNEITKIRKLQ